MTSAPECTARSGPPPPPRGLCARRRPAGITLTCATRLARHPYTTDSDPARPGGVCANLRSHAQRARASLHSPGHEAAPGQGKSESLTDREGNSLPDELPSTRHFSPLPCVLEPWWGRAGWAHAVGALSARAVTQARHRPPLNGRADAIDPRAPSRWPCERRASVTMRCVSLDGESLRVCSCEYLRAYSARGPVL